MLLKSDPGRRSRMLFSGLLPMNQQDQTRSRNAQRHRSRQKTLLDVERRFLIRTSRHF
jgi:hypothetical protein